MQVLPRPNLPERAPMLRASLLLRLTECYLRLRRVALMAHDRSVLDGQ
jgi:hypothetical protein